MALNFILGSSGSGKSTHLYEQIVQQAKEQPLTNFYVIVPEQFTMQTQRELVVKSSSGKSPSSNSAESSGIMNIDVVSFQRLAYRIFDELGQQDMVVLEETGKNLLLRKVAADKKDELQILAGNLKKMGYVSEIKSLISELTQYNISPEYLEDFLKQSDMPASFVYKIEDILTMYRGFQDYLQGKYVTAEEILEVFGNLADESELLKNSVLAFDGFTGFTPIQNNLLMKLMTIVKDVYVTVTIDPKEDMYTYRDMQELFAMSKKTIASLIKMADRVGMHVNEPVILDKVERLPMLAWLEQNLFRMKMTPMAENDGSIQLYSLMNAKEELIFVAGEIKRLIREAGYRYKDFAVVTGDVETYGHYVPQVFGDYDIPFFLDTTKNILLHPFIEFIRAVLEMLERDFSYDSVFRYFRSNLVIYKSTSDDGKLQKVPVMMIDRLENYVLAAGIRGHKMWAKRFSYLPKGMTQEQLEELEGLRQEQMERVEPLRQIFLKKHATVREKSVALYVFIKELEIEQQLKEREEYFKSCGEFVKEKEYAQIYRIVMDLLDKMASLLGDEEITIQEYTQILDAGFEAAKVGVIPSGYDRVTVGDIERTRLEHIKVLFFVGVNDGIVPKSDVRGGIISQLEREELLRHHLELAPTARERVFIQRFYLYLTMTKPSERLYITCARVNGEGAALRKSYLIGTMLKLFPQVKITELDEQQMENQIVTPKSSASFYLEHFAEQGELWKALEQWYENDENYREWAEKIKRARNYEYAGNEISRAISRALYGSILENSVTRLEQFAACACAHFFDYGLHLNEREISQFAAMDMGNIYHLALEKYAGMVAASKWNWFDISTEVQQEFISQALRETILETGNQALAQTYKNQYFLFRMKKILSKTITTLTAQVQAGKFEPSEFEVAFAFAQDLEAVNFALSPDERMRLRGRIDRVDTYEEEDKLYVKVIDYKSGNTSFELLSLYHGLQLQLVVYMNAAMELLGKKHPDKEVIPAGIFYYHIDDPVVEGQGSESDVEIYERVLEKLKLDGLVNTQDNIYQTIDTQMGTKSKMIPIAINRDGSLSKNSKAANGEDFKVMSEYVNQVIQGLGERIVAGEVKASPYQLKDRDGCMYCPYRSVCGIDAKIPGYGFRKLEQLDRDEEIFSRMKEKVGQEEK